MGAPWSWLIPSLPQVPGGLARLSADLLNYQKHLDWLRRAGPVLRPLEQDLGALHARLERLVKRLEHLVRGGGDTHLSWGMGPVVPGAGRGLGEGAGPGETNLAWGAGPGAAGKGWGSA